MLLQYLWQLQQLQIALLSFTFHVLLSVSTFIQQFLSHIMGLFFSLLFYCLSPGNIRNTERLSYDKQQHYKIMVTAYDCGQKRAMESVPVHIDVKPVCKPGWQGQQILLTKHYVTLTFAVALFLTPFKLSTYHDQIFHEQLIFRYCIVDVDPTADITAYDPKSSIGF